ncbi:MAG: T9SS type A sorting domain-containing protein [Flavobacteriales bacterium]|nr:T9SS type A sorting domain-containing protein [Flavobacteriales bacterium]
MKRPLLLPGLLLLSFAAFAQHAKVVPNPALVPTEKAQFVKSEELSAECLGLRKFQDIDTKWMRTVGSRSIEHGAPNKSELDRRKAEKTRLKFENVSREQNPEVANPLATDPVVGTNFLGNELFNGTPADNNMAISNGGIIVSADNATMEVYDGDAQDPYLFTLTAHSDFFNFLNPAPTGNIYDPKVLYDSGADRFIYLILHGTSSQQSELLICFSQSNNPAQDGWWVYRVQANQAHPGSWFDYPNIGVSNNEFYVSGNMFTDAGQNSGNILFQIEKNACYNGQNINYQYWANVVDQTQETAFTMVPLSWGQQGNYGPGVLLVANETSEPSDRIMVFDLTDDMSSSNEQLNAYSANTDFFDVGGQAAQSGSNVLLDIGDNRIQNGFYLNGTIHMVFTSDIGQGWNGINYKRINVSNMNVQGSTFGNVGSFDYCYPAVASSGSDQNDKSVIIGFLRSGQTIFPEFRAVNCDHNMQWSNSVQVKAGEDDVNIGGQSPDRWGDYSGISRRNGANRTVWASGCYGMSGNNFGVNNGWNAWIAELTDGGSPGAIEEEETSQPVRVFPNPAIDQFSVSFDMLKRADINVSIYDMEGKLVKVLLNDNLKPGGKTVQFNRNALTSGTYLISVTSNDKIISNEKLVIN